MRIDLLVINWSLPFSFIYHSSLSSKISIYFTSFKVRNKKFKWVLHTVVFYSNAHEILKTCFSNQDSHKQILRSFIFVVVEFAIRKYLFRFLHKNPQKYSLHLRLFCPKNTKCRLKIVVEIALTPNTPLIHTWFTYSIWNTGEICGLKFYLIYVHKSQKNLLKSLHAQRRSFLVLNLYFQT